MSIYKVRDIRKLEEATSGCHSEDHNPYKNSHEYSWESHEILMRKWKLSTILRRISWAFHQISWESHEIFVFTWKLERFLMRFSSFHELLVRFLMSFSWDSRESFFTWKLERFLMRISWECHEILMSIFGRFLMKTLNMEIDACTEFSWASHEILTRLKFSHEILMRVQWSHELLTRFSWDYHEILMRLSRDSHEIITRFLWDSHEIQVYRYNEHKPNPSFLFFNFFLYDLLRFVKWPWLQKNQQHLHLYL